jgi:hypothetical protein
LKSKPVDQQQIKKLAELKSFLERRVKQLEDEVDSLRSFRELVDSLLAERSFRPVELPASQTQSTSRDTVPIMAVDGTRIGSILVKNGDLEVTPEHGLQLDANSPPLRAFLVGKVLEQMQSKDKDSAVSGTIQPEAILAYSVNQEGGILKSIHIQNYGDERRLLELQNAIRWTFRRMHEKAIAAKPS